MSLGLIPYENNEINEMNCSLSSNDSIINTSGDSLYHNKTTNSDILLSSIS